MYNRYIPQPDGSFRRSRIQNDPPRRSPQVQHTQPAEQQQPPMPEPPRQEPCEKAPYCPRARQRPGRPQPSVRSSPIQASSFLKNLLPKDFDTSDLIIVLLLLLMAGDNSEDQNTALLTLALYFFM